GRPSKKCAKMRRRIYSLDYVALSLWQRWPGLLFFAAGDTDWFRFPLPRSLRRASRFLKAVDRERPEYPDPQYTRTEAAHPTSGSDRGGAIASVMPLLRGPVRLWENVAGRYRRAANGSPAYFARRICCERESEDSACRRPKHHSQGRNRPWRGCLSSCPVVSTP